jgi:probable HAF family extracellular repeat protein
LPSKPTFTSPDTTPGWPALAPCTRRCGPTKSARRSALSLAAGLALATLAPGGMAAPAVAHWTVTDLGKLGGPDQFSVATGINAAGQVVGYSVVDAMGNTHAFVYSNGTMTDLGTLGGGGSRGFGINDAGQVTGDSDGRAFLYSNGSMANLGTLGGPWSYGNAINAAGQITGYAATTAQGNQHAFRYSNGSMTDLGTLAAGGESQGFAINAAGQVTGVSYLQKESAFLYSNGVMTDLGGSNLGASRGYGINNAGQVTGEVFTNQGRRAFLYSNGTMSALGTLGGSLSSGFAINSAGQVTGSSNTTGDAAEHAFLFSNGTMTDLNALNGVAGSGVTLIQGKGINDAGQLVANDTDANRAYLVTLDTTVWEGGSIGSFASTSGWSFLVAPNKNAAVFIDPTAATTIAGPAGSTTVRQLTLGGDGGGNNGIATLVLSGGTINLLGNAGQFTTITAKGVLTGEGVITGSVLNQGTVNAANLSLPGGLTNTGTVTGSGVIATNLTNSAGGLLRADAGQLLKLVGTAHTNSGNTEVRGGGELQVTGSFTNAAAGRVVLDNGIVRFNGGLGNDGQVLVNFGGGSVFGAVTTNNGGKIIFSGGSKSTFYDAVDVKSGGELRISAGSAVIFFGQVLQRTGALFTGTGTKFYEGGLTIGGSPGLALDGGDVNLGAGNVFIVDIGGTTACTAECATNDALRNSSFDKYVVAGKLDLGGTLKLGSWNGYTLQAGQRFDLLDWGSASGHFDSIDTSGLLLADGTALDTSRLAIDGSFSVVAVPEPGTWALLLTGLMGVFGRRHRARKMGG